MKRILTLSLIVCLGSFLSSAAEAQIIDVPYASLTGTQRVDFNEIPAGTTNYDAIFVSGGVSFGEHFIGQTLTAAGDFDQLSGLPVNPLAPQAGTPNHNVCVTDSGSGTWSGGNVICGLGTTGYPYGSAQGEGAVAILFPVDQCRLGFSAVGEDSYWVDAFLFIDFFRRDGSLIQHREIRHARGDYGFSREEGICDIAGISIFNTDPGGVGFDNILFDGPVPPPEPIVPVAVDIMPATDRNSINLKSKGEIRTAILTTGIFDAATVDPTTVRFGPDEALPLRFSLRDVDRDGDLDRVLSFKIRATGIQCGDASAVLHGETRNGQHIQGADSISIEGCD